MTSVRKNFICTPCRRIFQLKPTQPVIVFTKDYGITTYDEEKPISINHYLTFNEFERSANTECHLCLLLFNLIPFDMVKLLRDPSPENGKMYIRYAANQQVSTIDLRVWYPFSARVRLTQNDLGYTMTLHMYPEQVHEGIRSISPVEVTSFNTGSDSSFITAQDWIQGCIYNHESCNYGLHTAEILPSRLIDIGSASDFSDIRLCTAANLEGEIVYVALSHCWGKIPIVTLTEPLRKAFEVSIPFESLSSNFKHAIQFSRKLRSNFNVRFLWIDSLCIMQDSMSDWQLESAKMGEVYKNAFCVLAATAGVDGSSGLFFDRNPLSLCPVILDTEWDGSPKGRYICKDNRPFDTDIANSPLLRRAWVVQERTLAKRILHFTSQQLYWECFTVTASEAHPKGLRHVPHLIDKDWSPQDFKQKRKRGKYYDPNNSEHDIYDIWYGKVLYLYSGARLTKESDKLIAISGIAKEMQSHLKEKDSYVAGLWKKSLVHYLLWEVELSTQNSYPRDYRAPSWSWASVDAQLRAGLSAQDSDTSLVTISSIEATPVYDNPFSSVKSGFLRITGFLIKVLLLPSRTGKGRVRIVHPGTQNFAGLGITDIDLHLSDTNHDLALCMPFLSREPTIGNENGVIQGRIKGLILKPTLKAKGQYERCGVFDISRDKSDESFMEACRSSALAIHEYETIEIESRRHTIMIV